jgi:hypothetical protein
MSREIVMSETLAHHLAVQGLARRPPSALLKEQVQFELADGTVVKPVDRAHISLYSKVIKKALEIHPFVIESTHEWLLIGGVDMVAMGVTKVLMSGLNKSYTDVASNVTE